MAPLPKGLQHFRLWRKPVLRAVRLLSVLFSTFAFSEIRHFVSSDIFRCYSALSPLAKATPTVCPHTSCGGKVVFSQSSLSKFSPQGVPPLPKGLVALLLTNQGWSYCFAILLAIESEEYPTGRSPAFDIVKSSEQASRAPLPKGSCQA